MAILIAGLRNDESDVLFALGHAAKRAPDASVASTLRAILQDIKDAGLPEASNGTIRCRLGELYDDHAALEAAGTSRQEDIAWLLRFIWAAEAPTCRQPFRAFAATILDRLPQDDPSNEATWRVVCDWLAEVQPKFVETHRLAFTDWLEETLTDPKSYGGLNDADATQVIEQLRAGGRIPSTLQLNGMFYNFTAEWIEEVNHFWPTFLSFFAERIFEVKSPTGS